MLQRQRLIEKDHQAVTRRLDKIISDGDILSGKKLRSGNYQFASKNHYGDLAMVDSHDFYIHISLIPLQSKTKLMYRIRGNQTFSIIAVVGFISLVPFLIFFLKTSMQISEESQALWLLLVFCLIIVVILFMVIQQRTKKLAMKGERYLNAIFERIEET